MHGALKRGMTFTPDTVIDAAAAREMTDKVAHSAAVQSPGPTQQGPAYEPCGLEPPSADTRLPGAGFFAALDWPSLRNLPGDTFVQIPKRFEQAFADAVGVALIETRRHGHDSDASLPGWKALLLLPWLLLLKPSQPTEGESCASLLAERLDRFWQGDVQALYTENLGLLKVRSRQHTKHPESAMESKTKRVKTLERAGEVSRALQAVHGQPRVAVTADTVTAISLLYPKAPRSG